MVIIVLAHDLQYHHIHVPYTIFVAVVYKIFYKIPFKQHTKSDVKNP